MTDPSARLTLVDAFVPQLTAGEYHLTATQSLYVEVAKGEFATVEKRAEKVFHVRAPRFALAPDEIYSRYPADGHLGAYHATVPHVVFRRKALPWERPLVPGDPPPRGETVPPDPWMALLVFDEEELPEKPFAPRAFDEVVAPPAGTRGPVLTLDPWDRSDAAETDPTREQARRCTTLDISLDLFRDVAPRRRELRLLAHARQVATHDKEDLFGVGDGWFAVVLANRLPAEGRRSLAVLVSLEGLQDLLEGAKPAGVSQVRLVVLDHWGFESVGKSFGELADALTEGKDTWLRIAGADAAADPAVRTALAIGHAPLRHHLRDGGGTVSWFRGPLVPVDIPAATQPPVHANADEALQYDPATGLFDASYAAAWQLGRLLALRSEDFARGLVGAQSGHAAATIVREAQTRVWGNGESEAERAARLRRAVEVPRDELMAALVLEWTGG